MVSTSLLLFQMMKKLPDLRILSFIGKHSITFYFFSGALPALCGAIWRRFFPGISHYLYIFAAISCELLLATIITWGIHKFAPFLLDLRKLTAKHK